MKALGLVVSEKKIFLYFSNDTPGAGPVWAPGARLAGFMKRTTRHCYTRNMIALGLVVSEKQIFICFSHCKSMRANNPRSRVIFFYIFPMTPPGRSSYGPQGHGWQDL